MPKNMDGETNMSEDFIAISGGFDPVHVGHLRMINDASAFGKVIVLLNSDEWLMRKKGYAFMPIEQRKEILEGLRNVHCVIPAIDDDDTVSKSIENIKNIIKYFGKGGDRGPKNTPEIAICEKYSISVLYNLGGNFPIHSSKLIENVKKSI
jgi:cytidyltransferase-like protein